MNDFDFETNQSINMVNRNAEQRKREAIATSRIQKRREIRQQKQKEKVIKLFLFIFK